MSKTSLYLLSWFFCRETSQHFDLNQWQNKIHFENIRSRKALPTPSSPGCSLVHREIRKTGKERWIPTLNDPIK